MLNIETNKIVNICTLCQCRAFSCLQKLTKRIQIGSTTFFLVAARNAGVPPSPCFPIFLARTTFVLESLPEAKNPGQDAFLGDFVFNSSYSRDNSLLD